MRCDVIYEFDNENYSLKHFYPVTDVISWELDTKEKPNRLIIKYEVR